MGPVRGRLTLGASVLASLVAGPAWAEVCDKERPGWDGVPVSAVFEAINLLASPAGLGLILMSAVALRWRYQWVGLAAVLLWTLFVSLVTMADPTGVRAYAMAEGCIGPPALFIVAAAAICVAIVIRTKPRPTGDTPPET